jgi:phosphonopyruvate decarboxylase
VYLQNSGEGNIINPVASLMNDKVYGIPCVFLVGWRGEPGVHDEPQHVFQGEVTLRLLEDMDIQTMVITKQTTNAEVEAQLTAWEPVLASGKQVALVVKKGALEFEGKTIYQNENEMSREEIIRHIVAVTEDDRIISTTGKASRELFEIREANGEGHEKDFLTVGSMGHSSSIALGIALHCPDQRIWIVDGDGAVLMHMGAMALLGSNKPKNIVHIVINNGAHESVGGMPTVANEIDLVGVARACGYPNAVCVNDFDGLDAALKEAKGRDALTFIEAKATIGARSDLGRPTTTAKGNKEAFMGNLGK